MQPNTSQIVLICSGILVTALFGVFLYRELFPEYAIYQNHYIALEEFRSAYTGQPPPPFKKEIKQIVIEREDKGPPLVDRCISCHVALQIPYFSPTKIAKDLNGNILRDAKGVPLQVPNEEYIWGKLDKKIAALRDEKVLEQLESEGGKTEVKTRLAETEKYAALKVAHAGHQSYDVEKVLSMHPLIGNETRPFEFHPIEEYGCTTCHNGNGKGLTTDKAHGPVFDGQYAIEFRGEVPEFTEKDLHNDPAFARVFNHKPGEELLFQTDPLFVGGLIEAKCMQCHQTSDTQLENASASAMDLTQRREKKFKTISDSYKKEMEVLVDLLALNAMIERIGYKRTALELKKKQHNYFLPAAVLENTASQINYLETIAKQQTLEASIDLFLVSEIDRNLVSMLGSETLLKLAKTAYQTNGKDFIKPFIKAHQSDLQAKGSLFVKGETLGSDRDILKHAENARKSFEAALQDQRALFSLSEVDELTRHYQRGKELYLSQACFACHRIAGFARGGVGPELTRIGESYPWYIKESIVWPQADLKSSTMPNMHLDHQELEDLMAFLLAQKGNSKAVAQTTRQADLQAWEAGRKQPWEKPISPAEMYDLNYSMTIFATEGCASCHRLQGYESKVGFAVENEETDFNKLYEEQRWFKRLFPEVMRLGSYDEEVPGSEIIAQIEKHAKEIDRRISPAVRENGLLEEIDKKHPEAVEALYSNFRFASRAKDHYYRSLIDNEKDPEKISHYKSEHLSWKERVHRILMMYIQTYGLGRLIGPHLNWSGIYRSDEWLMEHFRNPSAHVPHSIMPVIPFDDTKFYALVHMLNYLGLQNRKAVRAIWQHKGFDPQQAYEIHCAQCHGIGEQGYGVISEWIYPIPKSLKNPDFLRNLTKEEAFVSIAHGVKGSPMPPWGEVAKDKPEIIKGLSENLPILNEAEIRYLVDWIYSSLPGAEVIKESSEVPKWRYGPQDVIEELRKEGGRLTPMPETKKYPPKEKILPERNEPASPSDESILSLLPTGEGYYASLRPEVYTKQNEPQIAVSDIFDVSVGSDRYYIKKEYYTPHNLQAGQQYFLINCAACHGNEGDGTGARGQAMQDAKPRMLTNLDWIQSHDDLRLIRSIKFGIPGTSMTPWGDFTSSLQRLQLVMFIRTLTQERDRREKLQQALYQAFDTALILAEEARIAGNKELEKTIRQAKKQKVAASLEEVAELYQKNLEESKKIAALKKQDDYYVKIKAELKREKDLYFNLGVSLIAKNIDDESLNNFYKIIRLQAERYAFKDQILTANTKKDENLSNALRNSMDQRLEHKIGELEKEGLEIKNKNSNEQLAAILGDLEALKKLKAKLITDTEEARRAHAKQMDLLRELQPPLLNEKLNLNE
ncbi:MAG: c-type cytochrome [Candidatus Protochlamydia sp.]|nr:c-type cytochrome [Candidatus Protochlamydia sp.]